jgi:hypothetical protein
MEEGKGDRNGADLKERSTLRKRLTVDEVKQTEGFKHLSEEQAERYIDNLERYCLLLYKYFNRIKKEKL